MRSVLGSRETWLNRLGRVAEAAPVAGRVVTAIAIAGIVKGGLKLRSNARTPQEHGGWRTLSDEELASYGSPEPVPDNATEALGQISLEDQLAEALAAVALQASLESAEQLFSYNYIDILTSLCYIYICK